MSTLQQRLENSEQLPDDFERHEMAEGVFPDITARDAKPVNRAAFEALKASMVRYGFYEDRPIIFYEGRILDGWARYKAALAVGVDDITYVEWCLEDSENRLENFTTVAEFLIAMNCGRRQMTRSEEVAVSLHYAWRRGELESREDALRLTVELAEKWECSEQLVKDQIREIEQGKREQEEAEEIAAACLASPGLA